MKYGKDYGAYAFGNKHRPEWDESRNTWICKNLAGLTYETKDYLFSAEERENLIKKVK